MWRSTPSRCGSGATAGDGSVKRATTAATSPITRTSGPCGMRRGGPSAQTRRTCATGRTGRCG
jgi:hypothetical protein